MSQVVCLLWESVTLEQVEALGLPGPVQVNLDDADVASASLRLSTFDEPVRGVVSFPDVDDVPAVRSLGGRTAAYQVEQTVVAPGPAVAAGDRTPGLANVALLRIPEGMPEPEWRERWQVDHTPVAMDTQATTLYVQNRVLRALTPDAPRVDAIVEELFPIEALTDFHAFYGSGGDAAELERRMSRMLDSVTRFGADRDIDVVPTSRYVFGG